MQECIGGVSEVDAEAGSHQESGLRRGRTAQIGRGGLGEARRRAWGALNASRQGMRR